MPRSPQTPQTPTLGRTNSGGGPLKDRAKRASWGIVRNVSFLSRRPKKSSDGGDDGGTSPQSRADSLLRRPSLDMALGGSSSPSRRSSSAGGHGEPCGPPGGRLRLEAEHVHVSIATLVDWGLSTPLDEREVPQHTQHADAPMAPIDVALALVRAPNARERGREEERIPPCAHRHLLSNRVHYRSINKDLYTRKNSRKPHSRVG